MTDPQTEQGPSVGPERVRALQAIDVHLTKLAGRGTATQDVVEALRDRLEQLFPHAEPEAQAAELGRLEEILAGLEQPLLTNWSDSACAHLLFSIGEYLNRDRRSLGYVVKNIGTWLANHPDDAAKVTTCLQVIPPPGIVIENVLNNGAQKQVFTARWLEITPRRVAFKVFTDAGADSGDSFPHPLRGHHPNVIETYVLKAGEDDQVYLVEPLLQTTLSDEWDPAGVSEIVNLIRDMAHALSFVHGFGRIHGDIKLDNIGFELGRYILLDFGLCRSEPTDGTLWTPTGNVRAQAPELLTEKSPNSAASDIWALGSVAYAGLTGQPPLFEKSEKQHGFVGAERARAIAKLAQRANDDAWHEKIRRRLDRGAPEYELRILVAEMLAPDPTDRPSAEQVFERCSAELGRYLRPVERTVQLAPPAQLACLLYLDREGDRSLASRSAQLAVRRAAQQIDAEALNPVEQIQLKELSAAL